MTRKVNLLFEWWESIISDAVSSSVTPSVPCSLLCDVRWNPHNFCRSLLRLLRRSMLIICEILSLLQITQDVFLTLRNSIGECAYIILMPFLCCQSWHLRRIALRIHLPFLKIFKTLSSYFVKSLHSGYCNSGSFYRKMTAVFQPHWRLEWKTAGEPFSFLITLVSKIAFMLLYCTLW